MAFCNPKDQFVKKIGRQIAIGRMFNGKFFEFDDSFNEGFGDLYNIKKYILHEILTKKNIPSYFPKWFIKKPMTWLKFPLVYAY